MKSGATIFGAGRFAGVSHMPGRRPAKPNLAAVPASAAQRRMLATVHIAAKKLMLSDDDYRAILLDVTGQSSAGKCDEAQLGKVLDHFRSRGWEPDRAKGRPGARRADTNTARKARALWISLHNLGATDDPSERALEAFATRQLKCTALQWADEGQMFKLIEALKAMAERHGWEQGLRQVAPAAKVIVLKRRLVEAILAKLVAADAVPATWSVSRAAFVFGGSEITLLTATSTQLDIVARELGNVLRDTKGAS